METESLRHPSTWSSSASSPNPPQNQIPVESFIGSFLSVTSNFGLRYEGVLYHVNLYDSTLSLLNVTCYGTEGRSNIGFQIAPSYDVYNYIIFRGTEIKEYILVKPPTSLTRCGYGCLARGVTCSKHSHATKPPLPIIFSSHNHQHGAKKQDSDSYPLAQPQYHPGLDFYDPWSIPAYQSMPDDAALYQAPIKTPSGLSIAPQSFFTTFPPVPISLRPSNGGLEFETLSKNFMQYELWDHPQENNSQTANTTDGLCDPPQENKNHQGDSNTIHGSFYMISRNPFDPIGKPCNPSFGPIARPVKHI